MIDIIDIPEVTFTEPDTTRLIPQAYIQEPALSPLVDDIAELDFLAELERLTSGRQEEVTPLPSDFLSEELLTEAHGYGWTYVNAAFCHTRPTGNRFNGPDRGAWYAAYGKNAIDVAHAEVRFHLGQELEYTGIYENITDYRELIAGFTARFRDLSGLEGHAIFSSDTSVAYPEGQKLANNLRQTACAGILYPSVRHSDGNCLAAFRPNLVQNIRQGDGWRFMWSGEATPEITKL